MTAEKLYSINFTKNNPTFCLRLHHNGTNSYLFVNGTEITKFKAKYSQIVASLLYLGNNSKHFSAYYIKYTGFNGHIYDFSVDYKAIALADILDIRKYLIKINGTL